MLATLKASFADVFGRKTAWRCDGGPCGLLRAVRHVHAKRPIVLTNPSFRLQLVQLAAQEGLLDELQS